MVNPESSLSYRSGPLWPDGERIPDSRIRDVFRRPPDLPGSQGGFYRSSLIVGARGSGKTTLFKYLKAVHHGVATDISLHEALAGITKETGAGSLAFDFPTRIEPLVEGKATALMATTVAAHLGRKGLIIPLEQLKNCLPKSVRDKVGHPDNLDATQLANEVGHLPLEEFRGLREAQPLKPLIAALADSAQQAGGQLLLLFDRADMVPAPALVPVFELLDQSVGATVLVATRPGLVGEAIDNLAGRLVAGDLYGVVHLGIHPRSEDWVDFVAGAVEAQLGPAFQSIPKDVKEWVVSVSRDSVRWALELFFAYANARPANAQQALRKHVLTLQENQLSAAQRILREYQPDFRGLVNEIRKEAAQGAKGISAPVIVSIPRPFPGYFSPEALSVDRMTTLGIRNGVFSLPEGQRWVPGIHPSEFEVPPLLLWRDGDPCSGPLPDKPVVVKRSEKWLLGSVGRGGIPIPQVFVAFRLDFAESKEFRNKVEESIHRYPGLNLVKVTDGIVPKGARWAEVIRDGISKSRVVIGDITKLRLDVIFELGFAYGLGKPTVPVVSHRDDFSAVPSWLAAIQVGHFADQAGLTDIAASVFQILRDPSVLKVPRPPQPIPGLAVWARVQPWNEQASRQFETFASREGLRVELIPDQQSLERSMHRVASASLLVITMDGTGCDTLSHYIAGAVVAKHRAGYGGKSLARKILILEEPSVAKHTSLTASSLLKCQDVVLSVILDRIPAETRQYGQTYKEWINVAPAQPRWKRRSHASR